MRSLKLASFASLFLAFSMAACTVGSDDGTGNPPPGGGGGAPDANPGGGGGGTPDANTGGGQPCPPNEATFKTEVFDVAIAPFGCAGSSCHGGGAGNFRLSETDMAANITASTNKAKKLGSDGTTPVLALRPTQVAHGGQKKFDVGSAAYNALLKFSGQATGAAGACP